MILTEVLDFFIKIIIHIIFNNRYFLIEMYRFYFTSILNFSHYLYLKKQYSNIIIFIQVWFFMNNLNLKKIDYRLVVN